MIVIQAYKPKTIYELFAGLRTDLVKEKQVVINETDATVIDAIRNIWSVNGGQVNFGRENFDFNESEKSDDMGYWLELSHGVPRKLYTPYGSYNLNVQIYGGADSRLSINDFLLQIRDAFGAKKIKGAPVSRPNLTQLNGNNLPILVELDLSTSSERFLISNPRFVALSIGDSPFFPFPSPAMPE